MRSTTRCAPDRSCISAWSPLELVLPAEALARLDAATRFEVGFPLDFIAKNSAWVLGAAAQSG